MNASRQPIRRPLSRLLRRPGIHRHGHLYAVGLLVLLTLLYFNWQVRHNTRLFYQQATQQSRMLAEVIRLNAGNSLLSEELLTVTTRRFLTNTAEFIAYLNEVEPFSVEELTAFAEEAGLAGIRISNAASRSGTVVEGPPGWLGSSPATLAPFSRLPSEGLLVLTRALPEEEAVIQVGFAADFMAELEKESGPVALLAALNALPGIKEVRIEEDLQLGNREENMVITMAPEQELVTVTLPLAEERLLVVTREAGDYYQRIRQLWREFFLFSALIIGIAFLFSWLLTRLQQAHLAAIQEADRRLARQHEEATIGRAAATISHEIKNPLNAISIGLQRLQIELPELPREHGALLASMLLAVNRTSHIITGLKEYARPIAPHLQPVNPEELLMAAFTLHREECRRAGIRIDCSNRAGDNPELSGRGAPHLTADSPRLEADPQLLGQALENLVKNAIEAQPHGGFIRAELNSDEHWFTLRLGNGGLQVPSDQLPAMLEPYYSGKVGGSGLGLAITRRIVEAHGGRLEPSSPVAGVLEITLTIPLAPEKEKSR